jgi:hypothetical protein
MDLFPMKTKYVNSGLAKYFPTRLHLNWFLLAFWTAFRVGLPVSSGFGLKVGVIAQEYKIITRLFLCKHALVEDSGQNPHRAYYF